MAQGKFWEYHDKLFAQQSLSPDKLKSIAGEVGLDQAKFNQCLEKRESKASVDQDMTDATGAGVTGTPTFFVNGRVVSGARPFADFKQIIDEELAQK
jgi:protein-disulfide isomerase